jgi:hypothetical protein
MTNSYFSSQIKNAPSVEADLEQEAFDVMNGLIGDTGDEDDEPAPDTKRLKRLNV